MIHVAALLCLAAVQEPQEWKLELERLKARLAASEAEVESLRRRLRETPPPPATPAVPGAPKASATPGTLPVPPGGIPPGDGARRVEQAAKKALEEVLKAPAVPDPAPRAGGPPPVECVVSAVATEIGLVVISAGRERGVQAGDEFTVHRAGEFVAKLVVDRTDRQWSAGKITLKKSDPRVGDGVSNHIFVAPPARAGAAAPPADELRALRKELDEVRKQVRALSDTLVPSWQGPGLALEEIPEELRAHLGIARGVLVRRVREGSGAERAGLKANDLIPDLNEAEVLDALQKPAPLRVLRRGRELMLGR